MKFQGYQNLFVRALTQSDTLSIQSFCHMLVSVARRSLCCTVLPAAASSRINPPIAARNCFFSTSQRPRIWSLLMTEPSNKRIKMATDSAPVIGTHNGHFHADEALAVYLLRLLPTYHNASLIRTRDPSLLSTCTVVVDVGGVHDNDLKRYDHHQREFVATFPGKNTKLSSAGLVWMHYGPEIISAVTGLDSSSGDAKLLHEKLYESFVEAFDANDNGITAYDLPALRKAGFESKFSDRGFSIASVVNRYNSLPSSGVLTSSKESGSGSGRAVEAAEEDSRFLRASQFVGEQFSIEIHDKFNSWLPARALVKEAFDSRKQYDEQGRIIVIPYRQEGVPWMDHLYSLEEEDGVAGQVLYALFAEDGTPTSKWRIRAVGVEGGGFENRKSLPEQWRGVRDDELSKVSGVPGCVFVHAGGFIGGNATFEGALSMAQKAVSL